jgi:hypothetical protein
LEALSGGISIQLFDERPDFDIDFQRFSIERITASSNPNFSFIGAGKSNCPLIAQAKSAAGHMIQKNQ